MLDSLKSAIWYFRGEPPIEDQYMNFRAIQSLQFIFALFSWNTGFTAIYGDIVRNYLRLSTRVLIVKDDDTISFGRSKGGMK